FLRRDHALERAVIKWVVFHLDRKALVAILQRWPLRHGPGLEHAVALQAEVVMQTSRRVLLDHEQQRPAPVGRKLRRGLGCARERSLFSVAFERAFHGPDSIVSACRSGFSPTSPAG